MGLVSWQAPQPPPSPPCPPSTVASPTPTAASCRDGCTEAIILAHGFTTDFVVDLICAGLATGQGAVPPGMDTVKTEPLPGSLATVTSPPIMRASLREMA